ncbi:MAG: hypothetical protein A2X22_09890 [Bacteroidetes bacterium GWF2_49_14]|nr:MAG: hypothetical protein A2X22_09890 [Bacteroidetes bacterium GWF2_49_14]HBB91372.1 hypothetical protein [Bacteroidales bacterium]
MEKTVILTRLRLSLINWIILAIRLTTANGGWFNQLGRDWSISFGWVWSTCPFFPHRQSSGWDFRMIMIWNKKVP